MLKFIKFILLISVFVVSSAHALTITNKWAVSDAAGNCSGGPHGLWTHNLKLGSSVCSNYYSFQDGSVLTEYDNGTAVLSATAINPGNILATINITFGGLSDTHSPVKEGGGPELDSWYFYSEILNGLIRVSNQEIMGRKSIPIMR